MLTTVSDGTADKPFQEVGGISTDWELVIGGSSYGTQGTLSDFQTADFGTVSPGVAGTYGVDLAVDASGDLKLRTGMICCQTPIAGPETLVSGGSGWVYAHIIYTGQQFNPSTKGEIIEFDFSVDYRAITNNGGVSSTFIRPVLIQNGYEYGQINQWTNIGPGGGMTSLSWNGLTVADFGLIPQSTSDVDAPLTPDFSANAAPIQFGFSRVQAVSTVSYGVTSFIDDLNVTITSDDTFAQFAGQDDGNGFLIPAPAMGLVFGSMALILLARRR